MAGRLGSNDQEETRATQATENTSQMSDPSNGNGFPPFPAFPNDIIEPNETGSQIPVSYDGDIFKRALAEEYGEFTFNSISNLDGITPINLELLAGCLT